MSLVGLFGKNKKQESIALIDIGARSVAGGYAHYREEQNPILVYQQKLPVEFREGELQERSVLRALSQLGDLLIREGAPILARATGSGSVNGVLVSIDAPWQKTSVRTEYLEEKKPFVFTKRLVAAVLEKTQTTAPGKMLVDESVIGTILNGYETRDPYGKEVHRAEIVILTSLIDESVANNIVSILQKVFHSRNILPIAGSSLRYQAMRSAFPHERDAIILDVTGPPTSIALVRRDLFMSIIQISEDIATLDGWVQQVRVELAELARQFPLPRTIFLVAREPEIFSIQKTLSGADLGELWLSDNPPNVVPVLSSHLTGLISQSVEGTPDLLMLLMALYWHRRAPEGDS